MPSRDPLLYLEDILENIEKVDAFTSGMGRDAFLGDEKTVYAVIRALEIISEASRYVSKELRAASPHIPWREIAGAGNVCRHAYPPVDAERVWKTASEDLGPLGEAVRSELARLRERERKPER